LDASKLQDIEPFSPSVTFTSLVKKNLPSEVMTFFIFSQTVENFYIDFYAPITHSYLR